MRVLFLLVLAACAHDRAYADARTAQWRDEVAIGRTTRADVDANFGKAVFSMARPSIGWSNEGAGRLALDAEGRTGAFVARVEKRVLPETTSAGLTLGHSWFFYDRSDVIVDVVWERMGD